MDVMHITGAILVLSIMFQFTAAVLALRLIRVTGVHVAWVSLTVAFLFMLVRRGISLARLISGDPVYQPDPAAELVALITSAFLLVGVAYIVPLFRSIIRSEETLRKSEARLSDAQRIAHVGNWDWNLVTNKIHWSDEIYRIFGLPLREFGATYEAFLNIVHPDDLERVKNLFDQILYADIPHLYHIECRIVLSDGEVRTICTQAEITGDEFGNPSYIIAGTVQDITEQKQAEEHIKHLNSILKAIRNVNQLIVTEKDKDSLLKNACDALVDARGYEAAWLGCLSDDETFDIVVGSGSREDVDRFCNKVMAGDYPLCIKKALAHKGRFIVVVKSDECGDCFKSACLGKEAAIIRVEHADKFFGLLVISRAFGVAIDEEEEELLKEVASDIGIALHDMQMEKAHKLASEQIKASLKEKEVLLQEIHHRVKNNLQVVSSLLSMQARATTNKDVTDILTESRNRINAMALIHIQLYENKNLSEINVKEFVNKLLMQLMQSYPVRDTKITKVVSIADCPFPISMAVPVGLVINELLSNTLKYAFVGRKEGRLEVSLTASKEGKINLTISDDGVGLPAGFDINTTKTMGLHLVKLLVEDQLRGNVEITGNGGATFKIEFDIMVDGGI